MVGNKPGIIYETPSQRRQHARIAGLASARKHGEEAAARARAGRDAKYAREADPDSTMSPEELAKAVALRRREQCVRAALESSKARSKKKRRSRR